MKKLLIGGLMTAFLSTTALAGNTIIENEYVKAGVNETTGTFGSGGSTRPGLQYDSTGTSTFPADSAQGDYLTPGSPFDGFAVKADGVNYKNNNQGGTDIAGGWVGTPSASSAVWAGGVSGVFNITNTYSLPSAQQYIDITSAITAQQAMTTLSFGRFIDPDAMPAAGDTSATDNVLGYGTIPTANVVFSEATVSRYALGLYSTDSNVAAGIQGWSQEADAYVNADGVCGVGVLYCNGDDTIGLSWAWTGVSTGDILTANYAYIFGPSAFAAASTAISGGAGGGADITTGTLVDIGSATDVASGAAATPAPVITTATIVDTTRPVLTAGITHHTATETTTVQTIARETTTTTTTPMRTATYTDGVETSSVVATSTIASAITDPGSFTGRIDQGIKLENAVDIHSLGFAEGFTGGRINSKLGHNITSDANVYSLGLNTSTDNNIIIEAGINKVNANSDVGSADTTHLGFGVGTSLSNGATIRGNINTSNTAISYNRSIGDFSNSGEYSTSDRWAYVEVEPNTGTIRPVVGVTLGNRSKDAYTETGSIQSILTSNSSNESYRYATLGANMDLSFGEASITRTTEGTTTLGLEVNYDITKNSKVVADFNRSIKDDTATTGISAGVVFNF